MDLMTGVVLALGLSLIGEYKDNIMFRLGSAMAFLWVAFTSGSPFIMLGLVGISIYQFYNTFIGGN